MRSRTTGQDSEYLHLISAASPPRKLLLGKSDSAQALAQSIYKVGSVKRRHRPGRLLVSWPWAKARLAAEELVGIYRRTVVSREKYILISVTSRNGEFGI